MSNLPVPISGQPIKRWAMEILRIIRPLLLVGGDNQHIFLRKGAGGYYYQFVGSASKPCRQTWDGGDCRPVTQAGAYWLLDEIEETDEEFVFKMVQTCLPLVAQPGYCPASGTYALKAADGSDVTFSATSGVITDYEGTLVAADPTTGEQVTLTVGADGLVSDYEGPIVIADLATGISANYRVHNGLIKQ